MSQLGKDITSAGSGSATGNPRNKVALKPGRSLMDWIRLGHSGKDLTGVGGKLTKVTYQDLQKHDKQDDAWICIKGVVYNVSHYMEYHPGGISELMKGVGTDATKLFNETHQWVNYESMLQKCVVGPLIGLTLNKQSILRYPARRPPKLADKDSTDGVKTENANNANGNRANISEVYHRCTFCAKYCINYNTKIFKLKPPQEVQLEVPVGRHIQLKANIEGTEVIRFYTPVVFSIDRYIENNALETLVMDYVYLMIKIYDNGAMTQYLDSLAVGEEIEMCSRSMGSFQIGSLMKCKRLYLLAAGTGLTPMIRLLLYLLSSSGKCSDVQVKLIFFNKDEKDILWRDEFDKLSKSEPRFDVLHVLSEPHETWTGLSGRICKNLLEDMMVFPFNEEDFCCICGPTAFTDEALRLLLEFQFPSSNIHPFKS